MRGISWLAENRLYGVSKFFNKYGYMFVLTCIYMYVCVCIYISIYVCMCVCVCVYIYIYIYIYIYTHTPLNRLVNEVKFPVYMDITVV